VSPLPGGGKTGDREAHPLPSPPGDEGDEDPLLFPLGHARARVPDPDLAPAMMAGKDLDLDPSRFHPVGPGTSGPLRIREEGEERLP
jgi:hypothetical protein